MKFIQSKHLLLYVLIILATLKTYGQQDYVQGYIVLESNDTIFGGVKHRRQTFTGNQRLRKIRIRRENGKRGKYTRRQLTGYTIGGQIYRKFYLRPADIIPVLPAYYEIVPYAGEPHFLRLVTDGPLELYELEWTDDMSNEVDSFPLLRKKGEPYMIRATQGILGFKKKALSDYFKDCPLLVKKLANDEFTFAYQLVDFYNSTYVK